MDQEVAILPQPLEDRIEVLFLLCATLTNGLAASLLFLRSLVGVPFVLIFTHGFGASLSLLRILLGILLKIAVLW